MDVKSEHIKEIQYQGIKGFYFPSRMDERLGSIIYYVDGMLLDTGHLHARVDVLAATEDLQVDQMVITHHHEDHSANIEVLRDIHDCPVFATERCAELLKTPREKIGWARKRSWGVSPVCTDLSILGQVVTTREYQFQVIPVPGHSKDMIALYEPTQKWLFSADAYVSSFIGYFMREESMAEQILSLRRLLTLDFDAVICSHHPVWKGGEEKMKMKLDYFERTYQSISLLHEKGYSTTAIRKELGMKEYWKIRLLSQGHLSCKNMIEAVKRDMARGAGV